MAYVSPNFRTKKSLRDAIKNGARVSVYQPNGDVTGHETPLDGRVYLEGPHYPEPHKWYAVGELKDGYLILVK